MAHGELFVRDGETIKQAQRRENIEAPLGRCGDYAKPGDVYQGCGAPLTNIEWHTCFDFPDCCRP